MNNNKRLLNIYDIIWIDYILLGIYLSNSEKENTIILGTDFSLCKRNDIVFWILIELYLQGTIDISYINKNLKRLYTFTKNTSKDIENNISQWKLNALTFYGFIDDQGAQYDIAYTFDPRKILEYFYIRTDAWYEEQNIANAIMCISPPEQVRSIATAIEKKFRNKNITKKNYSFQIWNYLKMNTDGITSQTNPFLAILYLAKNWLIDIHRSSLIDPISDTDITVVFDINPKFFSYEWCMLSWREYIIDKRKDTIFLDSKTGEILLFWKRIDIKYWTRNYKFIEILYANQWEFIDRDRILGYIWTIQNERGKVLWDVSSRLPDEIKPIIEVSNYNYRLLNDTEILRWTYG